jgi:hemolysin III
MVTPSVDPLLWYCYERPKPRMRGLLHTLAFYASPSAWIVLLPRCATFGTGLAAFMSLAAASGLFWCSSSYHCGNWHSRKQLNHEHRAAALDLSMISLMISFSAAPCYALLLPQLWAWNYIALIGVVGVWSAATHSIAMNRDRKTRTGHFLLQAALASAPLWWIGSQMTGFEKLYLAIAGIAYLSGAACYAHEFPDPWPKTFGYHEIWHFLVVLAACMTMATNFSVVGRIKLV